MHYITPLNITVIILIVLLLSISPELKFLLHLGNRHLPEGRVPGGIEPGPAIQQAGALTRSARGQENL